jgi:hypothetical protein
MKNLPFFTTEHGVAALTLKEIPYQGKAYIKILETQDPEKLLEECVDFCCVIGAEEIFASGHPALEGVQMRAITPSARKLDDDVATVRFRLDPEKVLLFSKVDEKRIPCELK